MRLLLHDRTMVKQDEQLSLVLFAPPWPWMWAKTLASFEVAVSCIVEQFFFA